MAAAGSATETEQQYLELAKTAARALDERASGNEEPYAKLVDAISGSESDEELCAWFGALETCVSKFTDDTEDLLGAVLSKNWSANGSRSPQNPAQRVLACPQRTH